MEYIKNDNLGSVAIRICNAIHENASYLSEVDGATGDGDHGVNMSKGCLLAMKALRQDMCFSEGMKVIGRTLMMNIGGSMGPIYGTMFTSLNKSTKDQLRITKEAFLTALEEALQALMDLAGANVGDKTLIDTLYPAKEAYKKVMETGSDLTDCIKAMQKGAQEGKEQTKKLIAKVGRASRLGERSIGYLDAGATSCCIILLVMGEELLKHIEKE